MATTTTKKATKKTTASSRSEAAQKAAATRKRNEAAEAAEARSEAAQKAAATRKRNEAAEARKRKAAAEKAAATRKRNEAAAQREKVSPKRAPIVEREPRILAEDASFAAAGLAVDAVTLVKHASAKLEELRTEVRKAAGDPAATLQAAPATVTRTVGDVRDRLVAELETAIAVFEKTFDAKATEGRKLVESLKGDDRFAKLLDQSSSTRSQVKAALTSVTKTVDVALGAGRKQAETATSQIKGATTSVTKTVDAAVEAGREQAENASSQVKAAATSVRKSAETVPAAAKAVEDQVDQAS